MKISILGYGTFGSALGTYLSKLGHLIYKDEIRDGEAIFVAVPSYAVRRALLEHKDKILNQSIIICSKGFSDEGELLSKVLEREFPKNKAFFLYGPTLADGLANNNFSGMVLAGGEGKDELKKVIESDKLYIELSDDVVGVQVGATFKNVVNVLIGAVEGASFGVNTQAFVFAKGLIAIRNTGVSMGAQSDTFLGLTGAGDLYLKSRSREFGIEIGKGKKFEEVDKELAYTKEGVATLRNLVNISKHTDADLSFFKQIYAIVFEGASILDVIENIK